MPQTGTCRAGGLQPAIKLIDNAAAKHGSPPPAPPAAAGVTGATLAKIIGAEGERPFAGTDADAMVAGDVAMLPHEVTPVLKALRSNGIDVVAIHHHMTGSVPVVIFLHYFGTGPAPKLATAVRAAVAELGKGPVPRK